MGRARDFWVLVVAAFVEGEEIALDLLGWMRERAPPRCLCSVTATITLQVRGNSMQTGCLRVREQHQAETAPSSASGLESHVSGVTSLLRANSLLWDIQMPLWPLTLEGFLLHLLGKKPLFYKQQSDDLLR